MFPLKAIGLLATICLSVAFARPSRLGLSESHPTALLPRAVQYYNGPVITPKVFIISLFEYEAGVWLDTDVFGLLSNNISIPGLSPIYPELHCNKARDICQITTGESEINAATTISALYLNPRFDLRKTYFLIAGIAGINPTCGTTGSVTLARYAVQVGLEYEISPSELSANYSTEGGYIPLGAKSPDAYPGNIYGTEVFELSRTLRNHVFDLVAHVNLSDSAAAQAYRNNYPHAPANKPPTVIKGDVETSDVYWHGAVLGDAFEDYFTLLTNGSGRYCLTAQEDNAILEALIRATAAGLVDFTRIILIRTASNFDRAYPGETQVQSLLFDTSHGFGLSLANIYNVGYPIVEDIVKNWKSLYKAGIPINHYEGDILDSVPDGFKPDIGTPDSTVG